MKITIEAENDKEKEQMPEQKTYENVFEFGLVGRHIRGKIYEDSFSHVHITDKYVLIGKLHELLARLRDGGR